MKVVFWQSFLNPHQAPYIRTLAALPGWDVTVVAEQAMPEGREALGLSVPGLASARVFLAPDAGSVESLVARSSPDTIHVLEGIRGGCTFTKTSLPLLIRRRARIGIVSESCDPRSFRGVLRRTLYLSLAARYGADLDFVFAMGEQGVRWYRECGFPADRIFRFAYVTDRLCERIPRASEPGPTAEVTLAFTGQLIQRKGGDILLAALALVPDRTWRLIITGEGSERSRWEGIAAQLHISDRVAFTGAISNARALAVMASADVLVLPSLFDGWGAVVNEALMQGVPVLCSDHCGARDLVREPWRGEVFKAGAVGSLRDVLARWICRGKRSLELTERIKSWSHCIEDESMAEYFTSLLRHIYKGERRPTSPWL